MYTLYATLGSGNCFKPFLAMHQLSIPFRTIAVDVLSGQTRQEAFLASRHESVESVRLLRTYGDHAARIDVSRRNGLRSTPSVGVQM